MDRYPQTSTPPAFAAEEVDYELLRLETAYRLNRVVKRSSSPGLPWNLLCAKNASLIAEYGNEIVEAVCARVHLLSSTDLYARLEAGELVNDCEEWLVQEGYVDLVKLIPKDEPHSRRKREEKRVRLIALVSIVDSLVERALCSTQNATEISQWRTCPSKPGMGQTDADAAAIRAAIESHDTAKAEADISGFDWSVKEWELLFDARVRCSLAGALPGSLYHRILMNRIFCFSRPILVTGAGQCFSLVIKGMMLSGSYLTSSTNSRIRILLAFLAGASWAIAMGDDCVEEFITEAPSVYERLGHPLKNYDKCGDTFNFCSVDYAPTGAYPSDPSKTLYRLLEQPLITEELMLQFAHSMRHRKDLPYLLSVVKEAASSKHARLLEDPDFEVPPTFIIPPEGVWDGSHLESLTYYGLSC